MGNPKKERGSRSCAECGRSFSSDEEYGEHIKLHERFRTTPSPVPATERYHEGNPGVTAGVAQHEAGGQFSGEPDPERRPYRHRRKKASPAADRK
jgi:hypothetical protein